MKKVYELTADEIIRRDVRVWRLSITMGKILALALLGALVLFGFTNGLLGFFGEHFQETPPSSRVRLVLASEAALAFLGFACVYVALIMLRGRRRHHGSSETKQVGSTQRAEFHIDDNGITVLSLGEQTMFRWSAIEACLVGNEFLEIRTRFQTFLMIPKRVFDDAEELRQWTSLIEDHIT